MKADRHVLNSPVGDLLRQLEHAKVTDKRAERTTLGTGCLGLIAFIGAIVVVVNGDELGFWTAAGGAVGLLLAAAGLFVIAGRANQYDLDDVRLHSLVRLLRVLRADVPAATPVRLSVDFRDYKTGGERVSKGTAAPVYRQTWLSLQAPLLDGSRLALSLTDQVRCKEKRKRKYTKRTELWAGRVDLQLRLARSHGPAEAVAARLAGLKPPAPAIRQQAVGRGRALRLGLRLLPSKVVHARSSSTPAGVPEGRAVGERGLDALAHCYRGIAVARKAA